MEGGVTWTEPQHILVLAAVFLQSLKYYFKVVCDCFCLQDRPRTFDMHSLESSLIDIMRAENDSIKGKLRNNDSILVIAKSILSTYSDKQYHYSEVIVSSKLYQFYT